MSEKKKNTTQNEEKYFGKRGSIQENATKTEKIIGYVLVGVAVLAILLIIIISLLTGSEKNKIAKRFDSLTKDNVFTYVTYEKLQEKVQNGEEFEVVLVDDRNSNTNYFVYCVDLIVKQYQNDENYDSDEVIYLLITNNLKDDERKYFTNIDKRLLEPLLRPRRSPPAVRCCSPGWNSPTPLRRWASCCAAARNRGCWPPDSK